MIVNFGAGRIAGKAVTGGKRLWHNAECRERHVRHVRRRHALVIIFPIAFAQGHASFYNAVHGALSITPTGM
jgi:hypothetical protein